jgi:hypothetical protein
VFQFPFFTLNICDKLLSDPETLDFINSNKFDLVIIDSLWNDCAYGIAQKWNAKTIVHFTNAPNGIWGTETLGFLGTSQLWIADGMVPHQMPLTFLARVSNALVAVTMHFLKEWIYYPRLGELLKTKLDMPNMPTVREMADKTSLVLYNSHFSEEEARSLPPLFVAGTSSS